MRYGSDYNILAYVAGNDVLLRLTITELTGEGEQAVDLEACDSVAARVKRGIVGVVDVETGIVGGERGVMVVHLPKTLPEDSYALEVVIQRGGMQARSFDLRFAVVRRDSDANVPLTAIDGALTASLRVTLQVIAQATVRGKNAYEMWKELPGNEDKTLQDYIDEVLDYELVDNNQIAYYLTEAY